MDEQKGCLEQPGNQALSRRGLLVGAAAVGAGAALQAAVTPGVTTALAEMAYTPARPKIGFVLSHEQFPVPRLVEYAVAAEKAGFDMVWTSDHFQPWQDNEGHAGQAWVTLAAVGQRTSRILLGTGVTCPTYRYRPAIVAEAFASLALLSPGRVFLGTGTGEALNEKAAGGGWGHYKERAARWVEAVELIRKLWSGETITYNGQYYQVQNARLYDVPSPRVPIYMAAAGPKSARLAGLHGDGLITDPDSVRKATIRDAFAEGARAAGKDPTKMPIVVEQFMVAGAQEEAAQGARLWHFLPKAWKPGYVTSSDPRRIRRRAEAEIPLSKVYGSWPISTDPKVHIAAIQALLAEGVTHVFIHSPQQDQPRFIDFFGSKVLPHLR